MSISKEQTQLSALDVAKYLIWKFHKDKKTISNKKLQKLLYYSQAWSLVFNNKPLFKEKIEAWVHGPAIPEVYREYKEFGYSDIQIQVSDDIVNQISPEHLEVIDSVFNSYGKYNAEYLELLTHNETPWQLARDGVEVYQGSDAEITLKSMKEFYKTLYEQRKAQKQQDWDSK